MKIKREVVIDLLPIYYSGEASAATYELVEECFREDPELERMARSANESTELLKATPVPASKWEEKRALERAREKAGTLYVSGFIALILGLIVVRIWNISHAPVFLWNASVIGVACAVMALVSWVAFWRVRSRFEPLPQYFHFRVWAIFFSLYLLLLVHAEDHKIARILFNGEPASSIFENPATASVIAVIAVALWSAFFIARWRARRRIR